MSDPATSDEDRRRLASELLDTVRRAHIAWRGAPEGERDRARLRFMDALHAFNSLVLHDKPR